MNDISVANPPRMFGFVWRRIAGISQHLLTNDAIAQSSFDTWSKLFLNRYEEECAEKASLLQEQADLLIKEGVEHLYVSPEAVGSAKLSVFGRLLREIPAGSFLLVTSWPDLGPASFVQGFVERAAQQERYVILPMHKPLLLMPASEISKVHKSWVIDSILKTYLRSSSRREQILTLREQGLTAEEIQVELGISKSAYYRQVDSTAPIAERNKQIRELLDQNKSPVEIQAILKISSSTYYRSVAPMSVTDSVLNPNQVINDSSYEV